MFKQKKILVLAPHTDDGELGCGATIAHAIEQGSQVWYVAFSKCEESLPEGLPKDTLAHELLEATEVLGIPNKNVSVLEYKVRHFQEHRQEILDYLIQMGKEIIPDIIFMPSLHDIHQDHATIANEGVRAFKKNTIFMYELAWNNLTFNNQIFVSVNEEEVRRKVDALQKYKSQQGRQYTTPESIRSILKTHGIQIGKPYAEVFEVPRMVL